MSALFPKLNNLKTWKHSAQPPHQPVREYCVIVPAALLA